MSVFPCFMGFWRNPVSLWDLLFLSYHLRHMPSPGTYQAGAGWWLQLFCGQWFDFISFSKAVAIPDRWVFFHCLWLSLWSWLCLVEKRLDEVDVSCHTPFTKQALVSLLILCLMSTAFCYIGTVYQRLSVIAMGSLVSVIVANVVMENEVLNMSLVPTIFWSTPWDWGSLPDVL